jgi:glycosyltransferase involved in cell wall biosynthesis
MTRWVNRSTRCWIDENQAQELNPMNATIQVVHVIAQLRFGAGRCVADLAIEQARLMENRVIVCASTDADQHWRSDPDLICELASHGVDFRSIGDFFHRKADSIHGSGEALAELRGRFEGATVVHAHTAMAAAAGHWARPDALIATCHGWDAGRPAYMDLEDSLALQLCDSVVTYSTHWADRLRLNLAVPHPRKISMGIDLGRFPRLLGNHVLNPSRPRIVTVCELTRRKGIDILLNAMPLVWEQVPDTELHIMGNGDAAADLRLLAAAIDPGMKRVSFYGAVSNPYSRLGDFDLFILASRSDNLPIALLEAMLARLPIVASSVGGVPELIAEGQCGTVVPPESSPALAQGILDTFRQARDRFACMGEQGENYVRTRLDVRKTVREIEGIYRSALHRRGRRAYAGKQRGKSVVVSKE